MTRVGFLALVFAVLASSQSALAQSRMDAIRDRLTPELGSVEDDFLTAHLPIIKLLPGTWQLIPWSVMEGLTDEHLATQCSRSRVVIDAGLTLRLERIKADGETLTVAGAIVPWMGRVFSVNFDERAFLTGYLGLRDEMLDDQVGLNSRRGANRLFILTPRDRNLLVGYEMFGAGDAILFIRCPAPAQ